MKGVVFNLLEAVVEEEHGEAAWDGLLDATGLDGSYTSLGNYPDADLVGLVGAASGPEALRAVTKVLLVDRLQQHDHGTLKDLVLQRRYPDRARLGPRGTAGTRGRCRRPR